MNHRHLGLATAAAFSLSVVSANALTIKLEDLDTAATVTVVDGGAGDSNPEAGAITFIGAVGSGTWSFNVTTGTNNSTSTIASIDLNSVDTSTSGPGRLRLSLSDTGLTLANPTLIPVLGTFSIGGTTQGNVTAKGYVDTTDTLFGTGNQIGGTLAFSDPTPGAPGVAFSDEQTELLPGDTNGPFALTSIVEIQHFGNHTTSFNAELTLAPVPVPMTLPLLGSALALIGYLGRRRLAA